MANKQSSAVEPSGVVNVLLICVLCLCTLPYCYGQGMNVRNQNLFQCWPGVNIAGSEISAGTAPNADACASRCASMPGCTAFSLLTSGQCILKAWPFESPNGVTMRDTTFRTSCVAKQGGGVLPSPLNAMCYTGQDVAGFELSRTEGLASPSACVAACQTTPGCSFSVFRALNPSGNGRTLCQLKSNAFAGNEPPSVTRRDPSVTGLCFRALAVPQTIDPLGLVAGPVPFVISTKSSVKCLRMPSAPYAPGQSPVFMTDCSGIEALWTYNANTKMISHYASGLCLVPADSSSGATVVLSDSCSGPATGQVMARGNGGLQMFAGNRLLLPSTGIAAEGAKMVATSLLPPPPTNTVPPYQCYSGVDIGGDPAAPLATVANAQACAALCDSNPGCTFYIFKAPSTSSSGTCNVKYGPFTRNGVPTGATRDASVAAACFKKSKSGTLPSPAEYLCYGNQQIAGTILRTYPAANPQACVDSCTATSGCTFSYFDSSSQCTLGSDPFTGAQDNGLNRQNQDILNMCLRAQGAPDTIVSKGFVCYDKVRIDGGSVISTINQVASKEACAKQCEATSDVCTFTVYSASSKQCMLMSDAFVGASSGRDADKTSCLRSASGGSMNSPGGYLCYPSQSLSGTQITRGAGVSDSVACAQLCTATPQCTFTMYLSVGAGTCILKKDPFYGVESAAINTYDPLVTSVCLSAPGAPLVLSGFGKPKSVV